MTVDEVPSLASLRRIPQDFAFAWIPLMHPSGLRLPLYPSEECTPPCAPLFEGGGGEFAAPGRDTHDDGEEMCAADDRFGKPNQK